MAKTYDLGEVTAYAIAKKHGYTGTEADFAAEMTGAAQSARDAAQDALDAEAYATGKRNGTDVGTTDPAYHNNAKYWADSASGVNVADVFDATKAYAVGDYALYNGSLYRFTTAHPAGTWNANHVTACKAMDEVTGLKDDLYECFVEPEGAGKYITNVKVFGSPAYIAISNIRNNYGPANAKQTGFALFPSSEDGTTYGSALRNVVGVPVSGHFRERLRDGRTYEFDYDLSGLAPGTRDILRDAAHLIKQQCFTEIPVPIQFGFGFVDSFGVIGDSFASGEIYTIREDEQYHGKDYFNTSWGQILARKYGSRCVNFSKGGLTTRTWLTDSNGLTLLRAGDVLPLYLCCLGQNDMSKLGLNYLGSSADITNDFENNPDTFYGNYAKIVNYIWEKSPKAKVILMTFAAMYNSDEEAYNAAIKDIANILNIPFIDVLEDFYYESGSKYQTGMVQNHPVAQLYSGMAEANDRLLDMCIQNYTDYFNDYTPLRAGAKDSDENNIKQKLLLDSIPNTTQSYMFAGGSVSCIKHNSGQETIRTDDFAYSAESITETRRLETGESVTITTNLNTLETTIAYSEV